MTTYAIVWDIVNLVSPLLPRRCIVTRCKYNRKGIQVVESLNLFYDYYKLAPPRAPNRAEIAAIIALIQRSVLVIVYNF